MTLRKDPFTEFLEPEERVRDGSGDLVLGAGNNLHVAIGGIKPKRSTVLPMLEFLPNVQSVYALIDAARAEAGP